MNSNETIKNFDFNKVLNNAMETHDFKINRRKREELEKIFQQYGLTLEEAIHVFLYYSLREEKIPFEVPEHHTPFRDMKLFIEKSKYAFSEVDEKGVVICPPDAPKDIIDWIKHG